MFNGKVVDSSRDRGQPLTVTLGKGQIIKGWEEGIPKMQIGEIAQLICPP